MTTSEQDTTAKTACCGYYNPTAVKWNPYNRVVQCHNCGRVYLPRKTHAGTWRNRLRRLFQGGLVG